MSSDASTASAGAIETDVPARLDRLPWSEFHWMVIVGLGTVWILDGLEVTIIGSVGDRLTESGSGISLDASQIGTAAAFSFSAAYFYAARFFTGAGIGGEYAAINSAIDELIPARVRGRVDLIVNGSYWLGAAAGALVAVVLLDTALFAADVGWRLAFGLGALLGVGILIVRRQVPESPRWLFIQPLDREVGMIERALREHGSADGRELRQRVGARFWGPGRFRAALRETLAEGRAKRLPRGQFAPVEPPRESN